MIRFLNRFVSVLMIATMLFSTGFVDTVVVAATSLAAVNVEGTTPPSEANPQELPPPVVIIQEATPDPSQEPTVEPAPEVTMPPTEVATELPPDPTATIAPTEGLPAGEELPTVAADPVSTPIPETPIAPTEVTETPLPSDVTETPVPTKSIATVVPTEVTIGKIDVTANIEWNGGLKNKPSIGLQLLANKQVILDQPIVAFEGITSYTWSGLPDKDAKGTPLEYSVTEFVKTDGGWQAGAPLGYSVTFADNGLKVIYTFNVISMAKPKDTETPEPTPKATAEPEKTEETADIIADVIWPEGIREKPDVFLVVCQG